MLYALVILATASRLLPHPPNFACIAATGLVAGCYLRGWRALAVPMLAMLISDVIGHVLRLDGMGFYNPLMMAAVYIAIASSVWFGRTLKVSRSLPRLVTASFAMSTMFFILSNAAVWASGFYSIDFAGMTKCYAAALPFFQYTVAGDLCFSGLVFAAVELSQSRVGVRRLQLQVAL